MMYVQAPIDPKTWSVITPAVLALIALIITIVWAAKQFGMGKPATTSSVVTNDFQKAGSQPIAFWEQKIDGIVEDRIEPLITRVESVERNLHEFLVSRDKDWNGLTNDMASIRKSLHGVRNSLLVMRGHQEVKDDEV